MDTITNENGLLVSCVGPDATEAFRLRALIQGLKLEMKGLKLSSRMSALAIAKRETGLKTNKRELHIERLQLMFNNQLSKVLIVNKGEKS